MTAASRRGFSLIEVLFAAVILALAGVAVLGVFSSSTRTIQAADARTEYDFYVQKILQHAQSHSLHPLWDNYGPEAAGLDRPLLGRLALVDQDGALAAPDDPAANPLGFPQSFLRDLARAGLDARLSFDFFTREELGIRPVETPPVPGRPPGPTRLTKGHGLLHMQAGRITVTLLEGEDERPVREVTQPLICPQIVGKPGIKLSSCPAVNPRVRCRYQPLLAAIEGFEWTPGDEAACN